MRSGISTEHAPTKVGVNRTGFAPGRWLSRVLAGAIIIFFVLFFATPIAWLVLAPTKSTAQLKGLHGEQPFSVGSFAQLAENLKDLSGFEHGAFWSWFGNSLLYSGAALVITIVLAIPAGYALAMTNFRGRRVMLIATLMVMLIPNTALALPIFLELAAVHLLNTPLAVILPFSFFPFGVYLAFIFFSTSMSHGLLDAARIDGAGEFQIFRRIALPLATPVVGLVAFFNFAGNWNNFFLPFITEPESERKPVQVGLLDVMPAVLGGAHLSFPQLALAILISVAPILIVFQFSQRLLATGMTAGATRTL
jgi:multiple sugar transport system permease protein